MPAKLRLVSIRRVVYFNPAVDVIQFAHGVAFRAACQDGQVVE